MDVNRLTQGEKIAAGSAIALFIVMFLPWFGAPDVVEELVEAAGAETESANAWESFDFIDWILTLTVLVTLGVAAIKATRSDIDLPVPGSTAIAALGGLSTLLILYRIIDTPFDASRKFGVFLGLVLAAALAYGGWRAMEEEGTSFQDAADRLSGPGDGPGAGAGPGDRGATPPPPPPPPSGGTAPPPPPPPPPSGGNPPPSGGV